MHTVVLALTIYALAIVFALLIAAVLHGLGGAVKRLRLEGADVPLDLAVTPPDAGRTEQAAAVAVAVAMAVRSGRLPPPASTSRP